MLTLRSISSFVRKQGGWQRHTLVGEIDARVGKKADTIAGPAP